MDFDEYLVKYQRYIDYNASQYALNDRDDYAQEIRILLWQLWKSNKIPKFEIIKKRTYTILRKNNKKGITDLPYNKYPEVFYDIEIVSQPDFHDEIIGDKVRKLLNNKQLQVITGIISGKTFREIGEPGTTYYHFKQACRKIQCAYSH